MSPVESSQTHDQEHQNETILPISSSPSLILTQPIASETRKTHEHSYTSWGRSLTKEQYIENEADLASHLGIMHWILTQADLPPGRRPILASCETIRKPCFMSDKDVGALGASVIAIASVFCEPAMRGRGYASRMMKDLGDFLKKGGDGDADDGEVQCVGSVLWSDIGTKFYSDLGWKPFPATHIETTASQNPPGSSTAVATAILARDVSDLCAEDEGLLLDSIEEPSNSKILFTIAPNHHTMLWHHKKEEYICRKLFGKEPNVKGALVGEPGNRTWAIWTHGLYGPHEHPTAGSRLSFLRLVIENPNSEDLVKQAEQLKSVLQAAQNEAAKWNLSHVEMWNPDERTRELIEKTGTEYRYVERESEGIPSLMWFGKDQIEWRCEKFAWC